MAPPSPLIAFSADRGGGGHNVYTIKPDGSDRRNLGAAFLHPDDQNVAWSNDGKTVAFAGPEGIAYAAADGRGRRDFSDLYSSNSGTYLSWAPGGHSFAYSSEGAFAIVDAETGKSRAGRSGDVAVFSDQGTIAFIDAGRLHVMSADGANVRRLAAATDPADYAPNPPSWDPRGRRIAYEWRGDIWLYDLNRGRATNLTRTPGVLETEPRWSRDGRWIAFIRGEPASAKDARTGVSIVRPNGSGLRVLTNERFVELSPTWSPDSRRIAFIGGDGGAGGTNSAYLVPISGGKARRIFRPLCAGEGIAALEWGRGGRLAFASRLRVNDRQIYVGRTDGTAARLVASSCAAEEDPAWSPDGSRIAYSRDAELYVMRSNGSSKRRFTHGQAADWAPDGGTLVYSDGSGESYQIFAQPLTGGQRRQLTHSGSNGRPDWSAAAGRIAFTSVRAGRVEVYTMRADGSDERRVTMLGGAAPSWAPDGRRLAYVYGPNIWTIGADGQAATRLTDYDECYSVYAPDWSADGTTIAFGIVNGDDVGSVAFVPASGGEVTWMPYSPLVGAPGSDNASAEGYPASSPDWQPHGGGAPALRSPARRAGPARCITTG